MPANPAETFDVSVAAVTKDGTGIPATARMGGPVPSAPIGFMAVRDPLAPGSVDLSWGAPAWSGTGPVTGYEVASGSPSGWRPQGLVNALALPLDGARERTFYVRATNSAGASEPDSADVARTVDTALPSGSSRVVVTSDDDAVDVAFYGWVGTAGDDGVLVRLVSSSGKDVEERWGRPGDDGVSFEDVPNGRYQVTVVGHRGDCDNECEGGGDVSNVYFEGGVTVSNGGGSGAQVKDTFDGSTGFWIGVYPSRHRPRVIATDVTAFDGTGSMAITSTWNSRDGNVAVGTGGRGGVPVDGRQIVTVSAQGLAATHTHWNLGVSWWDTRGRQISLVRTTRLPGSIGAWRPSPPG